VGSHVGDSALMGTGTQNLSFWVAWGPGGADLLVEGWPFSEWISYLPLFQSILKKWIPPCMYIYIYIQFYVLAFRAYKHICAMCSDAWLGGWGYVVHEGLSDKTSLLWK
jgi:hypothetical protein